MSETAQRFSHRPAHVASTVRRDDERHGPDLGVWRSGANTLDDRPI
jgi:hypothetical protein